ILITNKRQQQGKHRHGKRRPEPPEPSRFRRSPGRLPHFRRDGWLGEYHLSLFGEHGCGAHVERAILAVKEVLLELISEFRIELIQQISLRGFLSDRLVMVHDRSPAQNIVSCDTKSFQRFPATTAPAGRDTTFFKY